MSTTVVHLFHCVFDCFTVILLTTLLFLSLLKMSRTTFVDRIHLHLPLYTLYTGNLTMNMQLFLVWVFHVSLKAQVNSSFLPCL